MGNIADVQEIVQKAVDQLGIELSGKLAEEAEIIVGDMLNAAEDITREELEAMTQAIHEGARVDEQGVVDRILGRIKEALNAMVKQVEAEEHRGESLVPWHGYEGRI